MKNLIQKVARSLGFELRRYTPATSDRARLQLFLSYYKIDLVLDVGANFGQYAKFVRDLGYSGRIVSFEPLSTAHAKLKSVSRKDPLWEIATRTAIGDADGEIQIMVAGNSQSSSVLDMLSVHTDMAPNSTYIGSETVALSKLDTLAPSYIKNASSIFLKIDVQGFEMQVIAGATQILSQVKGVQLELSLIPLYKGQALFIEMIEKMAQLGYELHAILPGFTNTETGRMLQADGIFFRKLK
jgi:FkbM family methyltransferase